MTKDLKASAANGIVVLNKPKNISSAKATAIVKYIFNAKKAGHAGTLDPFAQGVLVIMLNKAARLSQFFLSGDKSYEAVMRLGIVTDTQDYTGTVMEEKSVPHVGREELEKIITAYKGDILQTPPLYSALKHEGVPLYKLARKGKKVEKPPRSVYVSDLNISDVSRPFVSFSVTCSKGTYIRTLSADMGNDLGCGAHLTSLLRTCASDFSLSESFSLEDLENLKIEKRLEKAVIPMATALKNMYEWRPENEMINKLKNGIPLIRNIVINKDTYFSENPLYIKATDDKNNLLAVLKAEEGKENLTYVAVFN